MAGSGYADPPLPSISNQVFVVTNTAFAGGAYGNGASNNAAAINAAIAYASANGGGTVEIPKVGALTNYLSGPITMASHVNLQIDGGAMLQMLPYGTWPSTTPFIDGATLTDVEINGPGTIDGQGTNWWLAYHSSKVSRPNFVEFDHCTRVLIQNVVLQNPPTFHIYLKNSDTSVTIQGITINTPYDSPNTDGSDISSTNVLIRNCYISDGDDNLEIGGSGDVATDITVSNCTFGTGHGLSIGSKIAAGVNNLLVSNCTWNGTEYGIHMKSDRGIGGLVQNLTYEDLIMSNVNFAIAIYSYYNEIGAPANTISVTPFMASTDVVHSVSETPVWQNITISNVTVTSIGANIAGIIWGLPESLVSNVVLDDINISAPTKTFCVYNATGIQVIDSNFTAPTTGTNTWTIYNAGMTISNSVANTNVVTLGGLAAPPTNNVLAFFDAQAAITNTSLLGTSSITLEASTLTFTEDSVYFSNNLFLAAGTLAVTSGTNLFTGAFSGSGPLTLDLIGGSLLALLGDSTGFNGAVTISNGTLFVDNPTGSGTGAGALTVAGSATLAGNGVITGPVTVNGTLAPGNDGPGTLTISNNLALNGSSAMNYVLGTNSSLAVVSGNLALDGAINVTDGGGFTYGAYTLFSYGGTLTTNGSPSILTIGTVPNTNLIYSINISSNGYVRLIANTPPPTVVLTLPTLGAVDNTITLSATATDYVSVVKVEFFRDNGVLLGTVTTPPYGVTFDTTTVDDGSHCFYATAYDPNNNVASSSTNCLIVDNLPPTAPTGLTATAVSTNQINLNWSPSTDAAGVTGYQVIRGGSSFANVTTNYYSDSDLATATEYCYTVAAFDSLGHVSADAEVCAQTLGPASSVQGVYNGLVLQTNAPSSASSGLIQVTVTPSLSFTGKLTIEGARVSFGGFLDSFGNATSFVTLPGNNPSQVTLHAPPDGTDQITGTVSNSEFRSALLADKVTFSSHNPCPFAGRYTMVIEPPPGNDPDIPQGFGYGTLTVASTGLAHLQGVLGDGTKIKSTAPLSKHGTSPFYVPLYRNQGASVGWLTFATNGTIQATLDWFKPAISGSTFYPNRIATNVTLSGEVFVPPADNGPEPSGTRQVTLTGGNLVGSLVETAVVNSVGHVSVSPPNNVNLQMKLNPSTGLFSGSFTHPVLNKTVKFNGSSLQLDGSGAGLFRGSDETGSVILELAP